MGLGNDGLQRAANVKAPRAGNVLCFAVSGTAIVFVVPAAFRGKFCHIKAVGAAVDFIEGADKNMTSVVYNQVSTVNGGTKAVTPHAATGGHVPDGSTLPYRICANEAYTAISAIGSGNGFLYVELAE